MANNPWPDSTLDLGAGGCCGLYMNIYIYVHMEIDINMNK